VLWQTCMSSTIGYREMNLRVAAKRGKKLLDRAVEADAALDLLHLGLDACDLGPAELVDLVGRHRGGRTRGEGALVIRGPIGQLPDAGCDLVAQLAVGLGPRDELLVRRPDALPERRLGCGAQLVGARGIDLAAVDEPGELRFGIGKERRVAGAFERCAGD